MLYKWPLYRSVTQFDDFLIILHQIFSERILRILSQDEFQKDYFEAELFYNRSSKESCLV